MQGLSIDRLIVIREYTLLTTVVGVPVLFFRFTNDPFNVPKLALLFVGVAIALVTRVLEMMHGRSLANVKPLALPAGALAVAIVLSWLFSPYKGWGLFGDYPRFQGTLPYLLVILFGLLLADAFKDDPKRLAVAFTWAGAIVGGYTLIQFIGLDPFTWALTGATASSTATTGNSNFTGGFLSMALPVAVSLLFVDPAGRRRFVQLTLVIVGGWLTARSQGAWAAGVAGLAIVIGYRLQERWHWAHLCALISAAAIAVTVVGVVAMAGLSSNDRFLGATTIVRARWWVAAIEMTASSPLVGRGPNTFAIEGVSHRTREDALQFAFDFPNDPHSVPLALSANLGLLGLIAFIVLLVWTVLQGLRRAPSSGLSAGFFGMSAAYFVQSLVSIDELILRIGLWVAVAGLAATPLVGQTRRPAKSRRSKSARQAKTQPRSVGSLSFVLASLTVALAVGAAAAFVLADAKVRQGRLALAGSNVDEAASAFDAALSLREEVHYRGIYGLELKDLTLESEPPDPDLYASAVASLRFVDDIPFTFTMAKLADLIDEWAYEQGASPPDGSLELYEQAVRIDPKNPLLWTGLADALIHAGENRRAFAALIGFRDVLTGRYPEYWATLALAAAELGDEDTARAALKEAEAFPDEQRNATEAREVLQQM